MDASILPVMKNYTKIIPNKFHLYEKKTISYMSLERKYYPYCGPKTKIYLNHRILAV